MPEHAPPFARCQGVNCDMPLTGPAARYCDRCSGHGGLVQGPQRRARAAAPSPRYRAVQGSLTPDRLVALWVWRWQKAGRTAPYRLTPGQAGELMAVLPLRVPRPTGSFILGGDRVRWRAYRDRERTAWIDVEPAARP